MLQKGLKSLPSSLGCLHDKLGINHFVSLSQPVSWLADTFPYTIFFVEISKYRCLLLHKQFVQIGAHGARFDTYRHDRNSFFFFLNFEVVLEIFNLFFLKFGVTLKLYDNQQSMPSSVTVRVRVCVCVSVL